MKIALLILSTAALFAQLKDTGPRNIFNQAAAPATCNVGDIWFDSDATAGQNLYGCTAANTWTLQAGGGAGTVTSVADDGAGFIVVTGTAADPIIGVDSAVAATKIGTTRLLGVAVGDPAGSALATGVLGYTIVPAACTIIGWDIIVDAGTATVDVWKVATGTAKPTVAGTITAAAKPAIASGTAIASTTLTGWTTGVTAGDLLGFNLDAVATAKYITAGVRCR